MILSNQSPSDSEAQQLVMGQEALEWVVGNIIRLSRFLGVSIEGFEDEMMKLFMKIEQNSGKASNTE